MCYKSISIRSRDIFDQSLKLSEIAPISAPANFDGAGPQKSCTQIFIIASRQTTFGEIIPTGSKVIYRNTLNSAAIFEFWLTSHFFGAAQIFGPNF